MHEPNVLEDSTAHLLINSKVISHDNGEIKKEELIRAQEREKNARFYRKRIINLAKSILNKSCDNSMIDESIQNSFFVFACQCTDYFQSLDFHDACQDEHHSQYADSQPNDFPKLPDCSINMEYTDETFLKTMGELSVHSNTSPSPYKKEEIEDYPKLKRINLKDKVLKTKGIRARNAPSAENIIIGKINC
jgi:hypothetical protein